MHTKLFRLAPLVILLSLSLQACKKTSTNAAEPSRPVPAEQAAVIVASAPVVAATPPFDFNTVPEAKGAIPPFPYVDTPPKINENFLKITILPMDEVDVILGQQVHRLEGRVAMRTFAHSHAEMSELEVRRNYQNALQSFGAVQLNTVAPEDEALIAANGGAVALNAKLRFPSLNMAYDSYLLSTADKNTWIALMFADSSTRLVVVEEKIMQQSVTLVSADTMRTELATNGHIPLYINFDTDKATLRADVRQYKRGGTRTDRRFELVKL